MKDRIYYDTPWWLDGVVVITPDNTVTKYLKKKKVLLIHARYQSVVDSISATVMNTNRKEETKYIFNTKKENISNTYQGIL